MQIIRITLILSKVAFGEFNMCVSKLQARQKLFSEVNNLNFNWSVNCGFKFRHTIMCMHRPAQLQNIECPEFWPPADSTNT